MAKLTVKNTIGHQTHFKVGSGGQTIEANNLARFEDTPENVKDIDNYVRRGVLELRNHDGSPMLHKPALPTPAPVVEHFHTPSSAPSVVEPVPAAAPVDPESLKIITEVPSEVPPPVSASAPAEAGASSQETLPIETHEPVKEPVSPEVTSEIGSSVLHRPAVS